MAENADFPPITADDLRFNFRSGRLCLAFVATVGERWRRAFDRLTEPADLSRWYVEADVLDVEIDVSTAGLQTARRVREAIYRQAMMVIEGRGWSAECLEDINSAATQCPLIPVLESGRVSLRPPRSNGQRAALSTVARDAIDMFSAVDPSRLRECANPQCGILFVDESRPGRRRWCSSETCGGQARAVAYRRRRRDGTT